MTIKEFARLCGCNPQTLRYYDHVGLLKPVKVDQWSGYRFYEEDQAFTFVKIKNLQKAGFTIEEIKALLDQDDHVIYMAFDAKITEAEIRLQEIKHIQKLYQTEMKQIQEKIHEVREKVLQSMRQYDPSDEFGISAAQYSEIIENVNLFFEKLSERLPKEVSYDEFSDGDTAYEETEYLDLLNNPNYTTVYEKHGWAHVKDFFDKFGELEDGIEYALVFRVDRRKGIYNEAFGNTILGIFMARNPEMKRCFTCSTGDSQDGQNHFWLLKRK